MKKELVSILRCIDCGRTDWDLETQVESAREVREGLLICKSCKRQYKILGGVLDALGDQLPEEVEHEKEHAESFGYLVAESGEKHAINQDTVSKFRDLFLSLPTGDGSHYFQPGGSFDNQAGNARRFFRTLDILDLKPGQRVVEVGASFGWASWRIAQKGCDVIAVDITEYLQTADLYFDADGAFFNRIMSDMSQLPFEDNTVDLIFSHSVIHHCKELKKLFAEFRRVLKPGGRVVALHECAFGIFEDKSGQALQEAIEEGFNENAYTIPQWVRGAKDGGFQKVKIHYFSFIDDYIDRKELRKSPETFKLRLARWVKSHPWIHGLIHNVTILPRIFLRPKSWMIVATK